jgi:hypothetical protein
MVRIVKDKGQKLKVDDAQQALLEVMKGSRQFWVGGEGSSYVYEGF